jgi:hypothetical protein
MCIIYAPILFFLTTQCPVTINYNYLILTTRRVEVQVADARDAAQRSPPKANSVEVAADERPLVRGRQQRV